MTNSIDQEMPVVHIALRARYEHRPNKGLVQVFLEGKASDYRQVAQTLSSPMQPKGILLRLPEAKGLTSPCLGDFTSIIILWGGEAVRLLHMADALLIIGGELDLDVLAENIRSYADQIDQPHAIGTHSHIEYFSGIGYLEPTTPSLILEEST